MLHKISLIKMVSSIALLTGAQVSCAGSTNNSESPASPSIGDEIANKPEAVAQAPGDESNAIEDADRQETNADESSEPATAADLQAALQVVLDDDEMRNALKLEEPGRFPLKIYGSGLSSELSVIMIGQPVEFVAKPEDPKKEAVLIFTKANVQGNKARFKFRYDASGIRGSSTATRSEGRWELHSSRFSEYQLK